MKRELLPGLYINGWGYNGSIPGPNIQVYPGDYVNIRVVNHLPEATSVHWHGLDVPNEMDGVPQVEPSPHQFTVSASDGNTIPVQNRFVKNTINVASGETYDVEFKANNPGNWPFQCHIPHHMSNNMQLTMGGMTTVISYQ